MCLFKWFRKNAAPEKSAVPQGKTSKSAPVSNSVNTFTEMRHQAGTGDPKLKGRHQSGSF